VTTMSADVVVVGGGVMGSAAAWQLAARGADTVLLERFEPGHVRGASHGASRIFRFAYPDPFYVELAVRALPRWRAVEAAAGRSLLTVTGGVDHGATPDVALIADALAAAGVPGQWLAPDAAALRWPGLRFDTQVLYHPACGRLDADEAIIAFQQLAAREGAHLRHGARVTAVRADGEVVVGEDTYRARRVVVAAGAWAPDLLAGVFDMPKLRITQEQPAHFAPRIDGEWPSFIHHRGTDAEPFGFGYGLRTPGEGIKVGFHQSGPACDPDARDFVPEPARQHALVDYVREWVPGVDADALTPISCLYATTPDEDFVVDVAGPIVVATGFSGHGFKFAPVIGELLADLALSGGPAPARFAASRSSAGPDAGGRARFSR
jgi:sarcosine oxidase